MPSQWIVARTEQHREKLAKHALEYERFTIYLPVYKLQTPRRGLVERCLIPGYVFVYTDLEEDASGVRRIVTTMGVADMLRLPGGKPEVVPGPVIEELQSREVGGVIQMPKQFKSVYARGEKVKVLGSALDAVFMEMVDRKRALIFISLLGKGQHQRVPLSRLVRADHATPLS